MPNNGGKQALRPPASADFGGNNGNTILPIGDLLNFNVVKQGSSAILNWQVTAGHNINVFTVEKSYNGRDFTTLQTMSAQKDITAYRAIDPTLQKWPAVSLSH